MWDDQRRCLQHKIAVEQYINIDGAGAIPWTGNTSHLGFDVLDKAEKAGRWKLGCSFAHEIEEARLIYIPDGCRVVDR